MTRQQIANTIAFLERAHLQGKEAPAFMDCVKALNALADVDPDRVKALFAEGDE